MSAKKFPTLVIVGRPNIGKSTLFNRIVGRRVAVVEGTPGITRDRLYAEATHRGRRFQVVDTGGILFSDEDPLVEQIRVQAQIAMEEAEVVIFLVDLAEGLQPADHELAKLLRGFPKPVLIVANKADNPERDSFAGEFYQLGKFEVFPVSAIHGRGVAALLDRVVELFPEKTEIPLEHEEIKLAIVGRPNVGKSSLLNAFTGEKRAIVSNIPGTTRDAIDTLVEHQGQAFRLIDTAGLRRKGKIQGSVEYYMALRATQAIERADCALIVVDGHEGLTDGDKRTAKIAHDLGKACVIAVNKWDEIEPPDGDIKTRSDYKKAFLRQLQNEAPEVRYAPVCFTSAKENAGLGAVLAAVVKAVENWSFRVQTGPLNRLIQDALFEKPLTRKGKALKIYYAAQPTTRPPTFILFCNDPGLLHFSYQRYLENCIRKVYSLDGTPIRLVARSSHERK